MFIGIEVSFVQFELISAPSMYHPLTSTLLILIHRVWNLARVVGLHIGANRPRIC